MKSPTKNDKDTVGPPTDTSPSRDVRKIQQDLQDLSLRGIADNKDGKDSNLEDSLTSFNFEQIESKAGFGNGNGNEASSSSIQNDDSSIVLELNRLNSVQDLFRDELSNASVSFDSVSNFAANSSFTMTTNLKEAKRKERELKKKEIIDDTVKTTTGPLESVKEVYTSASEGEEGDDEEDEVELNPCFICDESLLYNNQGMGGGRYMVAVFPCGHCFHEDCFRGKWASMLMNKTAKRVSFASSSKKGGVNPSDVDEAESHKKQGVTKCFQCQKEIRESGRLRLDLPQAAPPGQRPSKRGTKGNSAEYKTAADADDDDDGMDILQQCQTGGFDDHQVVEQKLKQAFNREDTNKLVRRYLAHNSSVQVTRLALTTLHNRMDAPEDQGEAAKQEFMTLGGHVIMFQSIENYGYHQGVCRWVVAVVAKLSLQNAEVLYQTTPRLVEILSTVMNKFPEDELIQTNACCTLTELCGSKRFSESVIGRIKKSDGLAAAGKAMLRFASHNASLLWNILALWNAAGSVDGVYAFSELCDPPETLDFVVATMTNDEARVTTRRAAVKLVLKLTSRREFRQDLMRQGGKEALEKVVETSTDGRSKAMAKKALDWLARRPNSLKASSSRRLVI